MEKELTREYVLHVAHLGRLSLTEIEIEKYRHQLKEILDEINKINEITFEKSDIMISPSDNTNVFSSNNSFELNSDRLIKNAPKTNGNYIEVRWLKND